MNDATRERRTRRFSSFALGMFAIVLLAGTIRIGYVAVAKKGPCDLVVAGKAVAKYHSECMGRSPSETNDQLYYNAMANQLARGDGFVNPGPNREPIADHPPLASVVLSAVSFAFDHQPLQSLADETVMPNGDVLYTHVREQRYFMALIGTFNVLLIGLLARRVGGSSVGLTAASIAAIYPNLWINDGLLFSETIAITCVVITVLLALDVARRETVLRYALLGIAIGAAALARSELLLFAPLVVVPSVWVARSTGIGKGLVRLGAAALAVIATLSPWVIYNNSRFTSSVLMSTNDGLVLAGSYCDSVFYGDSIGLWTTDEACVPNDEARWKLGDQSEQSTVYRDHAIEFVKDHKKQLPIVMAARVGRAWSVFKPAQMISYNEPENREPFVAWPGLIMYYLLVPPMLVGVYALKKCQERRALWLLAIPMLSVTAVALVTYGQMRLRATAEPSIVVLAAIGLAWIVDSLRQRRAQTTGSVPRP